MKAYDFIENSIGSKVFLEGIHTKELGHLAQLKKILTIVKLTRSGLVYLTDGTRFFTVPPRYVRECISLRLDKCDELSVKVYKNRPDIQQIIEDLIKIELPKYLEFAEVLVAFGTYFTITVEVSPTITFEELTSIEMKLYDSFFGIYCKLHTHPGLFLNIRY